jgi:SAM-dependent methyltransferase
MNKIFKQALDNVQKDPAAYTIMVIMCFLGALALWQLEGHERIWGFLGCLVAVLVALFMVLRPVGNGPVTTLSHPVSPHIENLDRVCRGISQDKPHDHPLLIMLGGYLTSFAEEISHNSIELAPKYYFSCFAHLSELQNPNIYAIADLNSEPERWSAAQPTLWKGVKERIFHLRWEELYTRQLDQLVNALKQDGEQIKAEGCSIRLITSRETDEMHFTHPLADRNPIGKHLLIIGNSLIGGYIKSTDGVKLFLKGATQVDVKAAKEYYDKLRDKSVPISPGMSAQSIRAAWLEKFEVGLWDTSWNGQQERGDRYVMDYDRHIYCWIPDYETLIDNCYRVARDELDRKCRSHEGPLRVLELGCGTGALTKKIAGWAIDLNKILKSSIDEYRVVDQSRAMIEQARSRLNRELQEGFQDFTQPEQLMFTADSMNHHGRKYDVIMGSLIFHFLLGQDWKAEKVKEVLGHLKSEWLNEGGCIIWADIFFTDRNRAKETRYWKEHMSKFGMSDRAINLFMENNKDMAGSPSFDRLKEILEKDGFQINLHPTPIHDNPFNIVKIEGKHAGINV